MAVVCLLLQLGGCERPVIGEVGNAPASVVAEVVVDETRRHQVIDGFGGFGGMDVWWKPGPHHSGEFVDLLINDLGVTILRDNIPTTFEPHNENNDPFVLDRAAFNLTDRSDGDETPLGVHLRYLKAMNEAGLQRLIVTIWSPPPWMKHNGQLGNGTKRGHSAPPYTDAPDGSTNQLRRDLYDEFAEYCVAYIVLLKESTGIDLYAISLQNEPRFSQFYPSAVHSPESLVELIRVVGRRFDSEGIKTKIFAPEDVNNHQKVAPYLDAILADDEVSAYVPIFAVHNYRADGVTAADRDNLDWRAMRQRAEIGGKTVWMTETSGYDTQQVLPLATSIYRALHIGNVSAWLYWQMSEGKDAALLEGQMPTALYSVSQQFYRHVRPGSVRVDASASAPALLPLAFIDDSRGRGSVIVINTSADPHRLRLKGIGAAQIHSVHETGGARRYTRILSQRDGTVVVSGHSLVTIELRR